MYLSKSFKSLLMFSFASVLMFGCATTTFNKDKVKSIKKVAIIGMTLRQQPPTDNLGLGILTNKGQTARTSKELASMSNAVYDDVTKSLARETGWRVLGQENVAKDGNYRATYEKKMTGLKLTYPDADKIDYLNPDGILDQFNSRSLSHQEKVALARSMGADAYADVFVDQSIDQGWLAIGHAFGAGDFSYKGRANLDVFTLDSDEPAWRIQNIDGEETKKASTLPKSLSVLGRRAELGKQASVSAFNKLIGTYSENLKK